MRLKCTCRLAPIVGGLCVSGKKGLEILSAHDMEGEREDVGVIMGGEREDVGMIMGVKGRMWA